MAARHTPHDQRTRDKIRTSQLINRLEKFVLEEDDIKMSAAQVRAALGLIKKVVPDMQAIVGDDAFPPVVVGTRRTIVDPKD